MDPAVLTQNPFAIVTFIVAPALLTNASCVLVLSTTNRMLRTREIMKEHHARFEAGGLTVDQAARLLHLVERVEKQGVCFLQGMRSIYVALGAFAAATLVTLFGAVLFHLQSQPWFSIVVGLGLALGALGVASIVSGCFALFRATHLSLLSIHEEAALARISFDEIVAASQKAASQNDPA